MRIAQVSTTLILVLFCICNHGETRSQKISVTGTLNRMMAIGAETTGWAVQLDSETTIDGKAMSSIQVSDSHQPGRLEGLESKRVKIVGKVGHRHGVETGDQLFIEISTIKEATAPARFSLSGSEWLLEDLGSHGVMDNVRATVTFPVAGRVTGNGSCNRFFGPAEITGGTIKLGPLASSRMACPEAVMNQETKYLEALQAAEHFEWQSPYLLIYCKGREKPLRFTRLSASTTDSIDQWLGRWDGPEGTFLQLSKNGKEYAVEIQDLDGPKTFKGFADGHRIRFSRDGNTEFLSAGDGHATGMKWLAVKKNCLLTKPGEGWCRN